MFYPFSVHIIDQKCVFSFEKLVANFYFIERTKKTADVTYAELEKLCQSNKKNRNN